MNRFNKRVELLLFESHQFKVGDMVRIKKDLNTPFSLYNLVKGKIATVINVGEANQVSLYFNPKDFTKDVSNNINFHRIQHTWWENDEIDYIPPNTKVNLDILDI